MQFFKTNSRVIALFLVVLFLTSGCKRHDSTKRYWLSDDSLVFNTIHQSDTFQKNVYCINNSSSKIKIIKVVTACGCTKTMIKDSVINAYDSVPIYINYIPAINKDSGLVLKYITIRTNSNPVFVNLKIKGEVIK